MHWSAACSANNHNSIMILEPTQPPLLPKLKLKPLAPFPQMHASGALHLVNGTQTQSGDCYRLHTLQTPRPHVCQTRLHVCF